MNQAIKEHGKCHHSIGKSEDGKRKNLAEKIRKQASRIAYNTNSHEPENKVNQDQYTIDDNLW